MKKQVLMTKVALLILIGVGGLGCAKDGGGFSLTPSNGALPAAPTTSPINTTINTGGNTGVTQFNGQGGGAVPFQPVSLAVMNSYVGSHPLNNPQNIALNVNLQDIGSGRFAGNIKITYNDTGTWYTGQFESGLGSNQVSYQNMYVGLPESENNQWFTYNNQSVFHGFFQDKWGAVMLVIDNAVNLGDGGGAQYVSGSVWFKNFPSTFATQSPEKCWFIMIGPFDCRTFLVNDRVTTTSALYPANGYTKLGSFTGLDRARAFNQ